MSFFLNLVLWMCVCVCDEVRLQTGGGAARGAPWWTPRVTVTLWKKLFLAFFFLHNLSCSLDMKGSDLFGRSWCFVAKELFLPRLLSHRRLLKGPSRTRNDKKTQSSGQRFPFQTSPLLPQWTKPTEPSQKAHFTLIWKHLFTVCTEGTWPQGWD